MQFMHLKPWSLVLVAGLFAGCVSTATSTSNSIPTEWLRIAEAERMRLFTFTPEGRITLSVMASDLRRDQGGVAIQTAMLGSRLVNRDKPLTDYFTVIDSFDVSPSRGEVVFSAKRRDASLDVGLVSLDGGEVQWVPADATDEIGVKWAPRGNKISYILRGSGGDVVRTFHVPTSFQFSVPFPYATIHTLRWDPAAERYAVAISTPDASDRIEVLAYSGEERQLVIPPAESLPVEVDAFTRDAVLLRPQDLRYDEMLPLVVWLGDFEWNDARAALMRAERVAMVVSRRRPDDALWSAIAQFPWIDFSSPFVVAPAGAPMTRGTLITGDPAIESGIYRSDGNVVRVAPAVVQSFAAGYIADLLKRTTPTNASSR
jgi:hypothetical protein